MKTEDLLVGLATDVSPIRRLPAPWLRASIWVAATIAYLSVWVLLMAPPGRMGAAWADMRFSLEQAAAGLLGLTAGAAALTMVVPGRSRRVVIAPLAAAIVWVGIVSISFVQDVLRYGSAGIPVPTDWPCVAAILMTGLLPAVALVYMLRRGAPLAPRVTLGLAVLAAAALANVTACIIRPHDASVTVLLWHGTTLSAMSGLGAWLGTTVLRWRPFRLRAV